MKNIYKLLLTKEEMNVIRNGLNLILYNHKNELSNEAKEWYTKVKIRFDTEYENQSS